MNQIGKHVQMKAVITKLIQSNHCMDKSVHPLSSVGHPQKQ